jgi:hypothetical protein
MRSLKQCLCLPVFFVSVMVMVFSVEAKKYYINPALTTGSNNGSSYKNAWQSVKSINNLNDTSGDTILIARGTTSIAKPTDTFMPPYEKNKKPYKKIYGFVCPHDTDSFQGKRPIVIDAYTDTVVKNLSTARPVISANGLPRTAAILLYNQSHWTIQNIEVRNYPAGYNKNSGGGYSQSGNFAEPNVIKSNPDSIRSKYLNWRWGILVYYDNNNDSAHTSNRDITIRQCVVDSVLGGDCNYYGPAFGPLQFNTNGYCPWWAQEYACFKTDTGQHMGIDTVVAVRVTGGIMIITDGYHCDAQYSPIGKIQGDGATTVDSVLIDSNNIHDIFGEGISVNNDSVEANNTTTHSLGTGQLDTNVRIIGDTIYRTTGNGIHLQSGTDSAIVSGNIIDSVGWGMTNYTSATGSRLSREAVGIEIDNQKNTVIQYNAISNTQFWDTNTTFIWGTITIPCVATDAEAIDFDGNCGFFPFGRVYVQYNYSCNNQQRFFCSCAQYYVNSKAYDSFNVNYTDTLAIVRYNISQNDGMGVYLANRANKGVFPPQPSVIIDSKGGTLFYNNVFYNDTGIMVYCADTIYNDSTNSPQGAISYCISPPSRYINNIFLTRSSPGHIDTEQNSGQTGTFFQYGGWPNPNLSFSHNCYFDFDSSSCTPWPVWTDTAGNGSSHSYDTFAILANPNIKGPGQAANGFIVGRGDTNNEIDSAQKYYVLKQPTPCYETGIELNNMGTFYDFWGTKVSGFPHPDVGAYQTTKLKTDTIPLQGTGRVRERTSFHLMSCFL